MKVMGYILLVFAVLMFVSSAKLATTKYDLRSTDDFSQFMGGLVFAILVLAGGIYLIRKSKK
jgi:hypothetical protein